MPRFSCEAVIFDLDGVLIDSDLMYERHWARWASQQNVALEHILAVHHGRPAVETIGLVAPHLDAVQEAKRFNASLEINSDLDGLVAFDGVEVLLPTLSLDRWAIATSAPRRTAISSVHVLDLPMPRVLVTSDDVAHGKPAPDPYLLAAEGLGRAPERCVVIEDSPAGITSARAAGARVIAVSSTHPPEALQAAHVIVSRFGDLQIMFEDGTLQVDWPIQT